MIKSFPHLSAVTGYEINEIEAVIADIELMHYHFQRFKGVEKGVKTHRHFHPSKKSLRDLQNRIQNRIFDKISLPPHLHGGIKLRGNLTNSKPHQGKLYKFKTDLKSYFDFVTNKHVYESLRALEFSQKVANLLTRATTFRGHLAQGPPTSPFLANLAGLKMDAKILRFCAENEITYTRFVDDLMFSSSKDFKKLVPAVVDAINEHGFMIGNKKTKYKKGRLVITGVDVGQNVLKPPAKLLAKHADPQTPEQTKRGLEYYFAGIHKANKARDTGKQSS